MTPEQFKFKTAPLAKSHNGHFNHVGGVYDEGYKPDTIIGHWHEDGSTFEIKCPPQLRESLLLVLNNLHLLELNDEFEGSIKRILREEKQ